MEWTTSKTDWQSSDRYDYREINKLNDNLSIVEKETEKIFDFYAVNKGDSNYTPYDIPYASTFNEIEDRLHAVNGAGYGYDIGAKKTYVANQPVMDFAELNRVESALERLHIENQNNIEILPKLTFRLGNMRGVKI